MRAWLALFGFFFLLIAGCSSEPIRDIGLDKFSPRKAEQELSAGIRYYEDGNYKAATRSLQSALDKGLTFTSDQVTAHKYLAFINCASEQERICREDFRKALELDPKFELNTVESGHPVWGPVFRGVRAEMQSIKNKSK